MTTNEKANLLTMLVVTILISGGFYYYTKLGPAETRVEESKSEIDTSLAWYMCKKLVTRSLLSPSSAEFVPQNPDSAVEYLVDGIYWCKGQVDSQNSFGAMLRTNFVIKIVDNGEKWKEVEGPFFQK